MSGRCLTKQDWADLAPTEDEMKTARLLVRTVLEDGFPGGYSLDGPLTKNGPHMMQLFDVICVLREGHTKRRAAQIRRYAKKLREREREEEERHG